MKASPSDEPKTYQFCRGSDIYVDRNSEMPMELGTIEYPYKEL